MSWHKRLSFNLQERSRKWSQSDLFRDTPIRLIAYANEVGEAFRAWMPASAVWLLYVFVVGYVVADALDKARKAYMKECNDKSERRKNVVLTLADTLTWQAFASLIIPSLTINRLCAFALFMFKRLLGMSHPAAKLFTTVLGLAAIPVIVKPIDAIVEKAMDATVRKLYKSKDENELLDDSYDEIL